MVESPSSSATQPSTQTAHPAPAATTPIGAIVGGVVGGLLLLLLIFLIIVLMRRRSRKVHQWEDPRPHPAPFLYAPRVPSSTTDSESNMGQTMLTGSASLPAGSRKHWASPSISTTSASTSGYRRETDAGRILSSDDDDEIGTLPPEYEQVFSGESSSRAGIIGRAAYNNARPDPRQSLGLTEQHQYKGRKS